MKVTILGSGYVGLTAGICLSDMGNTVICADVDTKKIDKLKSGQIPIYEPGLSEMMARNVSEKRLTFTTDIPQAIVAADIIFIAVGTPQSEDGNADLRYVKEAAAMIGKNLNSYKVIVDKSTVPVGTADMVGKIIRDNGGKDFDVVSNPEFLREGEAVLDFTNPDRIVIGISSQRAKGIMEKLYAGIARTDKPILFCDVKSAEMIKYASNGMLAVRISFMNEIALLCEKVGADIKIVGQGMGLDRRIGPRFLQAGIGYGGSCFPKDVQALVHTARQNNLSLKILEATQNVNTSQRQYFIDKVLRYFNHNVDGKTFGVWGLAFKPKTDDMREAPSITIIQELQKRGAKIKAFDPEAKEVAKTMLKDVYFTSDPYSALEHSDALLIMTEWNEFRDLDLSTIKSLLAHPVVFDGRNVYDPTELEKEGFHYFGVGRGPQP